MGKSTVRRCIVEWSRWIGMVIIFFWKNNVSFGSSHLSQPTNDDDETSGTLRENNCFVSFRKSNRSFLKNYYRQDSCPELDHGCAESCRKVLFPCLPPTTLSTTEITTKPPTTTTFVQPVHPTTVNTLPSEQTTVDTTPAMVKNLKFWIFFYSL